MKVLLVASLGLVVAQAAAAQTPRTDPAAPPAAVNAPPPAPTIAAAPTVSETRIPRPPRPRGVPVALAVEAAQAATAACRANGYKVNALVTDSAGIPIVLLSDDGAAAITQRIAMSKVQTVVRYKASSGAVAERAKTDAALTAELEANPLIVTPRAGAVPIMVGTDIVGAIAVSGAPGGEKDEPCAQAGLDRIKDRLR